MAITYKVLAQKAAASATDESLYTVPTSTSAIISSIVVANRGATSSTYQIAIKPTAGTTIANDHYLVYDATIDANTSIALTLGITMAAGNNLVGRASTANLTFSAFGSEVTA